MSQTVYAFSNNTLYKVEIGASYCSCSTSEIGFVLCYLDGVTFCPSGSLYATCGEEMYEVDLETGEFTDYFTGPLTGMMGNICWNDSIYYSVSMDGSLYAWNLNSGEQINLGFTGFQPLGEFTILNGEMYFASSSGIIKVDIEDPPNSIIVQPFPSGTQIFGLTASSICNTLLGVSYPNYELVSISLTDGAINSICVLPVGASYRLTTMLEHSPPADCDNYLDLDCNDSSGAADADYNSPDFNCLIYGMGIADDDIRLLYGEIISEMTIQINGIVPDAPFEVITSTGNVPNIEVTGSGTDIVTLTNTGDAKSTDFKDALRLIVYQNLALSPTGGVRTIEVQFTTESGAMSNVATAFIQVNELPLTEVDLGPDVEICEGETTTFDAGNPGADYEWSTGANSQTITVDEEDEYIVTVSDDINCPNQDTVELTELPVIHVALEGPFQTCDNEPLTLLINTDYPFPLTVEISATPGSPFIFNDVIGMFPFNDLPAEETEYVITSVTPSQSACIEITDQIQLVEVLPSHSHSFDTSICDGDSIWLGLYWETEAGVYENTFVTSDGCDSVVTTTLSVLPAVNILEFGTTCDSFSAGVFIQYLNNPNGCDTVIQTTVSLLPADTTLIFLADCNASDTGLFQLFLTNLAGCDSVVITYVDYVISPFTHVDAWTCDSSMLGVFQQLFIDQSGCDSVVVTTNHMAPGDTTYVYETSCDAGNVGVSQHLLNNQSGCDSLVITTVTAGIPDTTYLSTTSCDSASLGVFQETFTSISGCDSIVFTIVSYSATDSTFFQNTTCNSDEAGVFIQSFVNQFGCDSIVSINVELLPSNQTSISSTTCDQNVAGVFVDQFVNQYGCDSIVTLTVSLLPSDTSILESKTCNPLEVGSIENIYINQDGCDSLVIEQTLLFPLPALQVEVTSDFNGYGVSCFGQSDGSVSAEVTGEEPFTYLWSTGAESPIINGLSAGSYAVTITDANGCEAADQVTLIEPQEFSITFVISQPDCFEHQDGSITILQIGGVDPIRYSIDKISYQSSPVFNQLAGGTYTITAIDANHCEVREIIWINVPLMVQVELPDDQVTFPGDTVLINAIVNIPFDSLSSVEWSGLDNPACAECLSQPVAPIITTTYSVTVTSLDGCVDEDAMTLFLENNEDVYVPNVFSPNHDNTNDELVLSVGTSIQKILKWEIFDRWGNVVYSVSNLLPDDQTLSWDGTRNGKTLNPAVYAYRLIVELANEDQKIIYGDVTLIK